MAPETMAGDAPTARRPLASSPKPLGDSTQLDPTDALGFVTDPEDVESLVDKTYRFCRREPGAHVILTGTGNPRRPERAFLGKEMGSDPIFFSP